MITQYASDNGLLRLSPLEPGARIGEDAAWIDLESPPAEETALVRNLTGVTIPSLGEMQEIEASSSLYEQGEAIYLTVRVLNKTDTEYLETVPISFILSDGLLITVRHANPVPFHVFANRARENPAHCANGRQVLFGLIEVLVDRLADVLEVADLNVTNMSKDVFTAPQAGDDRDFTGELQRIGRNSHRVSTAIESLVSLRRMLIFLRARLGYAGDREVRNRIKTIQRDLQSLSEHANLLSGRIAFLLEATLGMINIKQTAIIKIFSVMAVVFLPPTVVASMYGMNFHIMPELDWQLGYPFAILVMIVSALLPYWFFKRRGWL